MIGVIRFSGGTIGYAYMDYSVRASRMFFVFGRGTPMGASRKRIRNQGACVWPLYLSAGIPFGIVLVFTSNLLGTRSWGVRRWVLILVKILGQLRAAPVQAARFP